MWTTDTFLQNLVTFSVLSGHTYMIFYIYIINEIVCIVVQSVGILNRPKYGSSIPLKK